ncbi:MAG: hypothetical protein KatS3mg131_3090 [Candidatus Tectimicrobiota bacterium]|nr:MAG: hypothetical protein KatS3mg131_3090 [Candidatus Tectomicrobia bacterium]
MGRVLVALLLLLAAGRAAAYELHLAHVDHLLFTRYVQTQGAPLRAERHVLPQLAAFLDEARRAWRVVLDGYSIAPLPAALAEANGWEAVSARLTPAGRARAWTVLAWEGTSGQTAVFRIWRAQANWQELTEVAVEVDGVLRRLPVQGVPLFGKQRLLAPALAETYIQYALERGTLAAWLQRHATLHDGLAVLVGRSHDPSYPDSVYLAVRMPPQARTYRVVLAWRNREQFEKGDGNAQTVLNN